MRINDLKESEELDSDILDEMELSDALFILSEMADDDKLSDKEIQIIEEMLEKILEEDDEIIEETRITDHADTKDERTASFSKRGMSSRIKNRIYQRRYRRRSDVKIKARKKSIVQKRCKGNKTAQLSKPGSTTYVCKLKNRFRSKLMKRVAKRYRR